MLTEDYRLAVCDFFENNIRVIFLVIAKEQCFTVLSTSGFPKIVKWLFMEA